MLYDDYKNKMEKIKRIKNKILKFKWPFIILTLALFISFMIISILMGKSNGIEIASSFTYGDNIELSCEAYMSNIVRYEYKKEDEEEWKDLIPTHVGKYDVRAISRGLFGEKVCASNSFEITKKDLVLDIEDLTIVYGSYPNCSTEGLLNNDSLTGISFSYEDLTTSNTLVNASVSGIKIINSLGEDVTDCYSIINNTSDGIEIEFSPLEIILSPDISNKVYDGEELNYKNSYVVLKNEIGYNDIVTIETKLLDSNGNEIEDATDAGLYKIAITKTYINGSTNPNYLITCEEKTFEIQKRDIVVNTLDYSKVYDGLNAYNNLYELEENYTLGKGDSIVSTDNNTNLINAGTYNNNISVKIYNNGVDKSDSYNIFYNYGKLNIIKRDIKITTSSNSKVYDGTILESKEYSYEGLLEKDSISLISNETILSYGTKENVMTFKINENDIDVTANYNFIMNYGTLSIKKARLTIKLSDNVEVYYNSSMYNFNDLNVSYEITNGTLYSNDEIKGINGIIDYDEDISILHVGYYRLKADSAIFSEVSNSDSYDITFVDGLLNIKKLDITIRPSTIVKQFDYGNNQVVASHFDVTSGTLLDGEDLFNLNIHYELNNNTVNPYNVGIYEIVIDSVEENNLKVCNDNLDDYNLTFEKNYLEINKKDVNLAINEQTNVYTGQIQSVDLTDIYVSDELLNNHIIVNSISNQTLLNASTYNLIITSYSFIENSNIKEGNYNIIFKDFNYIISKRELILKVKELPSIIYDGSIHNIDGTNFDIVSGSFVNGDTLSVVIKDEKDRNILNANTYQLIIVDTDHSLDMNYIFNFDESTDFKVEPLQIDVKPVDEEYIFDGTYKFSKNEYTLPNNKLLNNDSIDIFTKLATEESVSYGSYQADDVAYGAGNYIKSINNISFNSGDNVSVKDNYHFNYLTSNLVIHKRNITIKAKDITEYYGTNGSLVYELISYLTDNENEFGLIKEDSIYGYMYNNIDNTYLNAGVYDLIIYGVQLKRTFNGIEEIIDDIKDYNISFAMGKLNVLKRPVDIYPDTFNVYYDKTRTIELTTKSYFCYDGINEYDFTTSKLLFDIDAGFNMHFEYDSNVVVNPVNAATYQVIIDSYIEDNSGASNNFEFNFKNKEFTIYPLNVSVKYKDEETTYDGLEKTPTLDFVTIYNEFYASEINVQFVEDYKFINAGKYDVSIRITSISDDLMSNYNIIYENGTFTIKQRKVLIKLVNQEVVYDNEEHQYDTSYFDVYEEDGSILNNRLIDSSSVDIEILYSNNKLINAATYQIKIKKITISDNFIIDDNSYNNLYNYVIKKRRITIKAYPNSKYYDGIYFSNQLMYQVILDEDNEVSRINETGYNDNLTNIIYDYQEMVNAGDYDVSIRNILNQLNYDVSIDNSKVNYQIMKRIIHIVPDTNYELTYTGQAQTLRNIWTYDTNYDYISNYSVLDHSEVSVVVSEINDLDIINAGTYEVKLSFSQLFDNYQIYASTNLIVVNKANVIIKAKSKANQIFDNETHESYDGRNYTIIENGISYNNSFKDLSQTLVSVIYKDKDNNIVVPKMVGIYYIYINTYEDNPNYNIEISYDKDQTFEIVKRDILILLYDQEKTYDGLNYEYDGEYSIIEDNGSNTILQSAMPNSINVNILSYVDLNNTYYSEAIDANTYYFKEVEFVCLDSNLNNISYNYNVLYASNNKVEISKKKYNVYLDDVVSVYNGLDQSFNRATYVLKDLNGEEIELDLVVNVYIYKDNILTNPVAVGEYDIVLKSIYPTDDRLKNYEFNEAFNSKLTINRLNLEIEFNNSTYNSIYGDSFEMIDYTLNKNISDNLTSTLIFDYKKNGISYADPSLFDCGTYEIRFNSIDSIYNGNVRLDNEYIDIIQNGEANLVIQKRNLIIDATCGSKMYDGIPLDPNNDFILTYNNIIARDLNTYQITDMSINLNSSLVDLSKPDALIHAGEYSINSISIEYINSRDVSFNDNYYIDYNLTGNIYVITKRPLIIDLEGDPNYSFGLMEYDGYSHNIIFSLSVSNNLNGDLFEIDNILTVKLAGRYDSERELIISSTTNYSNIKDYEFENITLSFAVLRKDLIISTESATLAYDGYNHTFTRFNCSGLAQTDIIQINNVTNFKNVVTDKDNIIEFNIYNDNEFVNECYNILYEYGKINITPSSLIIRSKGLMATYIGYNSPFYSTGFIYNLGEDIDVLTNECNFTFGDSNLKIIKNTLTPYINVGIYTDTFDVIIKENEEDVTSNFDINYDYSGQIIINKRVISVEAKNYEGRYNGNAIDLSSLINLSEELEDIVKVTRYSIFKDGVECNTIKDAGTYQSNIDEIRMYNNLDDDMSLNYNVVYGNMNATHSISKYIIALVTSPGMFVWDGKDKSFENASFIDPITTSQFSPFEGVAKFSNFATLAAYKDENKEIKWLNHSITNSCDYDILDGDISLIGNYEVYCNFGTLSYSTQLELSYTYEAEYDGTDQTLISIQDGKGKVSYNNTPIATSSFSANILEIRQNDTKTTMINAGTYDCVLDYDSVMVKNMIANTLSYIYISYQELIEADYSITFNISINIMPRNIIIIPNTYKIEYDGLSHLYDEDLTNVTITSNFKNYVGDNKVVVGDTLTFSTNVMNSDIGYWYKPIVSFRVINSRGIDITSNYVLLNVSDTAYQAYKYCPKLQITLRTFEITSDKSEFKYDGTEHYLLNPVYDESKLLANHLVEYISLIKPGYSNGFKIVDEYGNDVTSKYTFKHNMLRVTGLTISIQTGSKSKEYDGSPLTYQYYILNDYYKGIKMDGLRDGDSISVTCTGRRTEVGVSKNYFNVVIRDSNGNNVTDLYDYLTYKEYGTLSIINDLDYA